MVLQYFLLFFLIFIDETHLFSKMPLKILLCEFQAKVSSYLWYDLGGKVPKERKKYLRSRKKKTG